MRPGVTIALTAVDRSRLEAIVGNRNAPQKHAWRAEIVLLSAGGLGTVEIMRRTGKSKTCVWRWQERFAEAGVAGLLRDKTQGTSDRASHVGARSPKASRNSSSSFRFKSDTAQNVRPPAAQW